ncbi:riboflavin biosynthesis protein RibF [Nannocystis bainbridge]|uniref:Riboflavin biosynthesis protein n=1 Tax=Nannocystis bainbridge TaxID=2995303 RepID=A0ABT5E930_9BACT|nr:riboflavin biosynthesis protein RibF [Nannocystis bainbridge]MDC0721925.1 riboflavin biosynthesis protein RibF [Nannocystis bainbridge]
MRLLRQPTPLPPGTAACIGAFDGLHLGHQALLRRAAALAPRIALVTFDPHPAQVLAPERAPPRLQTLAQRARVAAALGVDSLVVLPFTRALADTAPDAFVERLLLAGLRPAAVVVGPDFRFGSGRAGGPADLRRLLGPAGVEVEVVTEVSLPTDPSQAKLGSSGIRRAVERGDLPAAAAMLGRAYSVEGPVVSGARRGRDLGFPTANVAVRNPLLPPPGVYAGALALVAPDPDAGTVWPAVMNLGQNPTFGPDSPQTLEVHALDVDLGQSLYDRPVEVAFAARLRPEERFPSATALVAQIARDIEVARPLLTADWLAHAVLGAASTWDDDHV